MKIEEDMDLADLIALMGERSGEDQARFASLEEARGLRALLVRDFLRKDTDEITGVTWDLYCSAVDRDEVAAELRTPPDQMNELPGKLNPVSGQPLCRLEASGFTETPESVLVWADQVVSVAKKNLNGIKPHVWLWGYRHGGFEYLAADIGDELESSAGHHITFVIGTASSLNIDEPSVPDMADALHLVGIVAEALRADMKVGRRGNETNEAVLARPLAQGETNGKLRAAGYRCE